MALLLVRRIDYVVSYQPGVDPAPFLFLVLRARLHRRCQVFVYTSLLSFLLVAVDASLAADAYEVVARGRRRLCLAQATRDFRRLVQKPNPGDRL